MKTILVIEDENTLRESILQLLGFSGFSGIGAENGILGLQIARNDIPDLIICDIRMPDIDGFEVIRNIRAIPETSGIPFIFLTAKADVADVERGLQLGANAYIVKPFAYDALLAAINDCIK